MYRALPDIDATNTVCVIIEVEYPRLGLIRVDAVDQALVELRENM
jgi:hypothetical protein